MVIRAIDRALKRKDLSDAAASKLAVGHPSLIKNLRMPRDGDKRYNWTALEKLAEVLELELYFGPKRDASPPKIISADDEYASIPIHDAFLAAGYAAQNDTEAVIGHLAFRRDWLDRMGIAADKARIARVRGESMAPTLHDDDMVLIDTGARDVQVRRRGPEDRRLPPIYAVNTADGPRIKRVERPEPGQMQLLSDNNEYPVEVLTGDRLKRAEIIGRVVWWGHTVRE